MDYLKSCSKPVMYSVLVSLVLFSAGVSSGATVTVKNDSNGEMRLGPGLHYKPEISDGVGNDAITSLEIKPSSNLKATLFDHDDFTGAHHTYDSDKDPLPDDISKAVSSIIVEQKTPDCTDTATFFSGVNFLGSSRDMGVGYYYSEQLEMFIPASARIPSTLRVTIFKNKDFTGEAATFTSDTQSFGAFLGKINSMIVEPAAIPADQAGFYTEKNYQGKRLCLPPGVYDYDAIRNMIGNDTISSIKNPSGFRITLFDGKTFDDDDVTYTTNRIPGLGDMDDKTSSLLVEIDNSAPDVPVFYEKTVFGGKSMALGFGLFTRDVINRIGNDTISSLKVPAGFKVTAYQNDDFTGDSLDCSSDNDALASDWQKMITSIIVEKQPSVTAKAQFFPKNNYGGTSAEFGVGRYDKPWLERTVGNDAIASVQVPAGLKVTVFKDDGFKDKSQVCYGDTASLNDNLNGKVSSIVVEEYAPSGTQATFYEKTSQAGKQMSLGVGRYNKSTLDAHGLNNALNSLHIPAGLKATLYENDNFNGKTKTFYPGKTNIGKFLGGKTSSIVVESHSDTTPSQTFVLIADPQLGDDDSVVIKFQRFTEALDRLISLQWPSTIADMSTGASVTTSLELAGMPIELQYAVFAGDLVNAPYSDKINRFKTFFDYMDNPGTSLRLHGYFGFGNHDLAYHRDNFTSFIKTLNINDDAPLRPDGYNGNNLTYYWVKNGVMFLQSHRFGGDNLDANRGGDYGKLPDNTIVRRTFMYPDNGLSLISLSLNSASPLPGRVAPVILIQHYGWGTDAYWSMREKDDLDNVLAGIGIQPEVPYAYVALHGHSHTYNLTDRLSNPVISAASANPNWGRADYSYAYLVRVTKDRMEVVECELPTGTSATPVPATFTRSLVFDLTVKPVNLLHSVNP